MVVPYVCDGEPEEDNKEDEDDDLFGEDLTRVINGEADWEPRQRSEGEIEEAEHDADNQEAVGDEGRLCVGRTRVRMPTQVERLHHKDAHAVQELVPHMRICSCSWSPPPSRSQDWCR